MHSAQYDPFGEPIAKLSFRDIDDQHARATNASRLVMRVGTMLFWGAVVGIVAARAIYFNADIAKTFCTVAASCFH
jgi:hypothetical protein